MAVALSVHGRRRSGRPSNPFANLPMFGDLAKALAGQGPLNWDAARQFAQLGGHRRDAGEANVDPAVRIAFGRARPDRRAARQRRHRLRRPVARGHRRSRPARGRSGRSTPTGRCSPRWPRRSAAAATAEPDEPTSRRRRPDDGDDGRPQHDDGAGDDGHGRRLDGRAPRDARVRPARPADPPAATRMLGRAGQHRRFAAEWEIPTDEMRLWVLAHELTGHALFSITSPRGPRRPGAPARRRVPARSRRRRREARPSLDADDGRSDAGDAAGVRRSGGAARRGALARANCAASRRSTPLWPRSSATPTAWSTACRVRVDRRRRAADRRGRPSPPGRAQRPTTCSSSGCSASASATTRCSGARRSSAASSTAPARHASARLLARPECAADPDGDRRTRPVAGPPRAGRRLDTVAVDRPLDRNRADRV